MPVHEMFIAFFVVALAVGLGASVAAIAIAKNRQFFGRGHLVSGTWIWKRYEWNERTRGPRVAAIAGRIAQVVGILALAGAVLTRGA